MILDGYLSGLGGLILPGYQFLLRVEGAIVLRPIQLFLKLPNNPHLAFNNPSRLFLNLGNCLVPILVETLHFLLILVVLVLQILHIFPQIVHRAFILLQLYPIPFDFLSVRVGVGVRVGVFLLPELL